MRNVDDVVVGQYYRNIMDNNTKLNKTQQQIATGKRFQRPSEAPSDAVSLLRIDADRNVLRRQSERMVSAREIMSNASTIYENIDNIVLSIDSLTMQAMSGTNSQESRESIADEIALLIDEVAQEASRNYKGKPILGKFMKQEIGDITRYDKVASSDRSNVYINEFNSMRIIPEDNIAELLNSASAISKSLKEGDSNVSKEQFEKFREVWNKTIDKNGEIGSRENFLTDFIDRNESMDLNYEIEKSNLLDVDLARASIDLKTSEQSFNLSLTVSQQLQALLDPNKLFTS